MALRVCCVPTVLRSYKKLCTGRIHVPTMKPLDWNSTIYSVWWNRKAQDVVKRAYNYNFSTTFAWNQTAPDEPKWRANPCFYCGFALFCNFHSSTRLPLLASALSLLYAYMESPSWPHLPPLRRNRWGKHPLVVSRPLAELWRCPKQIPYNPGTSIFCLALAQRHRFTSCPAIGRGGTLCSL